MKKVLIGCFACLVAFFGVLFSVGSSNTNLNLLFNNSLKNAAVLENNNDLILYFDNNFEPSDYTLYATGICSFTSETNFIIYDYENNNTELNTTDLITNDIYEGVLEGCRLHFVAIEGYNPYFYFLDTDGNEFSLIRYDDLWEFVSSEISFIISALKITNISDYDLNNINIILTPYIGNLTSLPGSDPSSPSDNPLNDISNTINGVIDWFVDLFNGLSDIFIVSDINGNFLGFSLWGNILFIELSVGLVIIVLRWVISLIKGI